MKVSVAASSAWTATPRASAPASEPVSRAHHSYVFVESELLPCVDIRRSMAALLLPYNWRVYLHALFARTARQLRVAIALSFFLAVGVVGASSRAIGAWLAVLVLLLQFPSYLWLVLTLRIKLVRLLVTTFDFWFFTLANALCMFAGVLVLEDARVAMLPALWLGFQLATLIDASLYVDVHYTISALLIALMSLAIALLMTAKERAPSAASREGAFRDFVLTYGNHSLSMSNVFANLLCTMAVLECRNGFRKWIALKVSHVTRDSLRSIVSLLLQRRTSSLTTWTADQQAPAPPKKKRQPPAPPKKKKRQQSSYFPTNECIGYHCDVMLSLLRGPRASALDSAMLRYEPERLQFVPIQGRIDAENVVLAWLSQYQIRIRFRQLPRIAKAALLCVGAVSLVSIWLSVLLPPPHVMSVSASAVLSCLALVGSLVVFSVFALFYQLQLLWRLCCTFDCVFLSLYTLMMHVCACDMMHWDHRCVFMVASWLWWLWVLSVDALTPVAKRKFALQLRWVALVALTVLLTQLTIAIQYVTNADSYGFHDSKIFLELSFVHHGGLCVCVVPVFFSCLLTVASLMVRILWRLTHLNQDVLVLVEGNVRYNVPVFRRPSKLFAPPPDLKDQAPARSTTDNHETATRSSVHPQGPMD